MNINTIYIFSSENKIKATLTKLSLKDGEVETPWPYRLLIITTSGELVLFLSRQDLEQLQFILTQSEEDISNA